MTTRRILRLSFFMFPFWSSILLISKSSAILPHPDAQSSTMTISDDLVSELNCQTVTPESIQKAINPVQAFGLDSHIPDQNWNFSVGAYELGACWSLSRTQRLLFYLGRENIKTSPLTTRQTLSMIRKYTPKGVYSHLHIVPWNLEALENLKKGWREETKNGVIERNFKNDIQVYQNKRFHEIENTQFLDGDRERSTKNNQKSFQSLVLNLKNKKLTHILLRPAVKTQHVVVAKYYFVRPTGEYDFHLYDSNRPQKDMILTYDPKTKHFYAPEIVKYFKIAKPEAPIGIFLVDESESEKIFQKLTEYYQLSCQELLWAKN